MFSEQEITQYNNTLSDQVTKDLEEGKKRVILVDNKYFPKGIKRFTGFQMGFEKIAKYEDLTGKDCKILFYLFSQLDMDNYIQISQQEISDELNIKIPNVSRSIKKLCDKEIIKKEKKGKFNFYRINPEIAWKGETERWKNVIDITSKLREKHLADQPEPF